MTGTWTIFRRELLGLFLTPLAWILLCGTLLYNGLFFMLFLRLTDGEVNAALNSLFSGQFWYLVVFLPPLLTMRMISEESSTGVLEFLLTAPVSDTVVVLGKMLAATSFMALVFSAGFLYAGLTQWFGADPDWGTLFTGWIGAVLVSALFCSLGLVASAISGTPLVAAFLSILGNIVLLILPLAERLATGAWREPMAWLIHKLNLRAHFDPSFARGALDSAHLIFFVAWIVALVFLAVRVVESRRWLG